MYIYFFFKIPMFFSDRRDTFCYFWLQKGVKWDILERENASKCGVSKQWSYIKISLHTQCKVCRNTLSQKIHVFDENLNSRKINEKKSKKSKTRTILREVILLVLSGFYWIESNLLPSVIGTTFLPHGYHCNPSRF